MAKSIDEISIRVLPKTENIAESTSSTQIREFSSGSAIDQRFLFGNQEVRTSSINFGPQANYKNSYEVVQVSGRTNNNKSFVYNNGVTTTETSSIQSSTVFKDDAVQNRKIQKNVFVERFSAPGGPETNPELTLNRESGEFSVYNSINNRNLLVRNKLNEWSAESSSITSPIPSFHKINKNPKYRVDPSYVLEGTGSLTQSFVDIVEYDNLFVQHQIPQSDKQYAWIRDSLQKEHIYEPQYRSRTENQTITSYFRVIDIKKVDNYNVIILSIKNGSYRLSHYKITDEGREKLISLSSEVSFPFSSLVAPSFCITKISNENGGLIVRGIIGGLKKTSFDSFAYIPFTLTTNNGISIEDGEVYSTNVILPSYPSIGPVTYPSSYTYALETVSDGVACAITYDQLRCKGVFIKYDETTLSSSANFFEVLSSSLPTTDAQLLFTRINILPVSNNLFVVSLPTFQSTPANSTQIFKPIAFNSSTLTTSSIYDIQNPTGSALSGNYFSSDFQYLAKDNSNNVYYTVFATQHLGTGGNYNTSTQTNYLKNKFAVLKVDSNYTCSIVASSNVVSSSYIPTWFGPSVGPSEILNIVDTNNYISNHTQDSSFIDFNNTTNETTFRTFYMCNESSSSGVKLVVGTIISDINAQTTTLQNKQELLGTSSYWTKPISVGQPNDSDLQNVFAIYENGSSAYLEHISSVKDSLFTHFVDRSLYTYAGINDLWERQLFRNFSLFTSYDTTLLNQNYFVFKTSLIDPIIDFCGTNLTVVKNYDSDTNTISLDPESYFYNSADIRSYLTNLNGFYGFSSWKQVRTSENYYANKLKKENKYFIDGTNFFEPPITYQKPLKLEVSQSDLGVSTYTEDYINKHTYFTNENLVSKLDEKYQSFINSPNNSEKYNFLKDNYDINSRFVNIGLTEVLYPKKNYLTLVRERESYEENSGTGSDGFDRNTNDINSFWKNDPSSRTKTEGYSFNNLDYKNQNIINDNDTSTKKSLLVENYIKHNNLTKSFLGMTDDKLFSFWSLDNFFLVNNSLTNSFYSVEDYQKLFANKFPNDPISSNNISSSNYQIVLDTKQVIGDLAFPGYSEERKITFFIPDNTFGIKSFPRTPFIYNPFSLTPNYEPFGWFYNTSKIAGKNPWYDSYEQYSEDLKPIGQYYSVLPEYNLSDNIKHYLNKGINVLNKAFLNIKGQNVTSSLNETINKIKKYSEFSSNQYETNKAKQLINFGNNSSVNSLTASNIDLLENSLENKNYNLKNNIIPNRSIDDLSKFEKPTSLVFNNTGSESSIQTVITSINDNLSGFSNITSPNLTTASFAISTWFKLSEDAYKSSSPVGLFTFTNATDPDNYYPVSLGVALKTTGLSYRNSNIDTDVVVYNNGPHDAGNNQNNVYSFYNNDLIIGANSDYPSNEITLDDKWHHLFLQYQKPQNFSATYSINQFQTGVVVFPNNDEIYGYPKSDFYGVSTTANGEFSIDTVQNILLTESNNSYTIANINFFGSQTDSSPVATSEFYGVSIYNLKGDKYTLLDRKVIPALSQSYRTTFFAGGFPMRTFFDVKPLGKYNGSDMFLLIYNYFAVSGSSPDITEKIEYSFCKYDTQLSCSSPKVLLTESLGSTSTAGYITRFNTVGLEYDNGRINRFIINTNHYRNTTARHTSSINAYQINYANETLVSGVLVNQYTSSNATHFTNNLDIISASAGYAGRSFIESYTVAGSPSNDNYFKVYVSNSLGNYTTYSLGAVSNIGTSATQNVYLKYFTGSNGYNYYIMNRLTNANLTSGTLYLLRVDNVTSSFVTSSGLDYQFNILKLYNNPDDIYVSENKFIIPTGYLTSSISLYTFNTSSMSITKVQDKLFVEDPVTIDNVQKIKDSSFIETLKKPYNFNNRFSSSFNVPFSYFDTGSLKKYLTTIKVDINTGSNAQIRLFLDGKQKYGAPNTIFGIDVNTSKKDVLLVNQPYYESGDTNQTNNNLNKLTIGYSTASQLFDSAIGFKGEIDEVSLWYGSYTTAAVEAIYNNGVVNNVNTLSTQFNVSPATYYTSSDKIQTSVSGNIFGWYRVGYYDLSEENIQETYRYNDDFFEKIGEMDLLSRYKENNEFITHYEKILSEHTTSIQKISITVNGISKLLPYNGFYPSQRTAQIGKLFMDSVGSFSQFNSDKQSISLTDGDNPKKNNGLYKINDESVSQAFLQPFMAPGILYNSIKSGLGVDWPIFIDNTVTTASTASRNKPTFYQEANLNLDGVKYIINSNANTTVKRVPFESLLDLSKFPKKNNSNTTDIVYYQNPTIYSLSSAYQNYLGDSKFLLEDVYPYFIWDGTKKDSLYELAINNFVSETPRFFLQNKGLTTFKSAPSKDILPTVSGTLYIMDVNIYKDENFDMVVAPFTNSVGKYFGPPVYFSGSQLLTASLKDPAYAPYTPPYLYGKNTLRIKYLADKNSATITDIISKLQTEVINIDLDEKISALQGSKNSTAYLNKMNLDSCIVYNATVIDPSITIKEGDSSRQISDNISQVEQNKRWVISTKWETPVLNYQDNYSSNKPLLTENSFTGTVKVLYNPSIEQIGEVEVKPVAGTGIWSGYSTNVNSGIKLSISTPLTQAGTASLADLCKFESTEKKLGQIADKKEIYEAIVLIPYYENTKQTNLSEKFKFISLDKKSFKKSYEFYRSNNFDQNTPNSIVDMIKKMENYEIPLHLDFLTKAKNNNFTNYNPFAMYIFEFSRDLDRQDLADIWQGILPKAGLVAQKDSVTIEHHFGPEQLIEKITDPKNLKWLIFKVKRKAEKFYDQLTDYTDSRFNLLKIESQENNIGYNWPYDYCSLVELANVEVKFSMLNDLIYPKNDKTIESLASPGSVSEAAVSGSSTKVSK
jgi:hypothetical protein